MPRKSRRYTPGALHHVIIRGIEKRKIFRSDFDRKNFINRLTELIPETKTDYFAWVLMSNHVYLLLRTVLVPVSCPYFRKGLSFVNRFRVYYSAIEAISAGG